ncbi:helix-turn-helix domain-containing protein [Bradyrhizobium sp. USDA 329]|uniref:AlbA family DNA-binding domain-containing protein n=1 Tax=unclassified Bradyrhizobium TaxID=2631580 RepID=UPI003515C688
MLELPENIGELLTYDTTTGAVSTREGKRLEFKRDFSKADFSDYTKVLASFANALGGVIIFGVSDSPRHVEGCALFPDEADWANRLREDFDPEIPFAVRAYRIGAVTLQVVGVGSAAHKPILCKKTRSKTVQGPKGQKDVEVLREGAIYYRYSGQTRLINYSDLSNMLAERESLYLRKMMETLQVVQKVGLENAGVVDMSVPQSSVYMSAETAKGLAIIDKATIVQEKGAPAYVMMGNITTKEIVHAPFEDADKNIPMEAAAILSPTVSEVYQGDPAKIHPAQVTKLLQHLGIDKDNRHCLYEKKLKRKYVTREGLKALEHFIRTQPQDALKAFGSKEAIARFVAKKLPQAGDVVTHPGVA